VLLVLALAVTAVAVYAGAFGRHVRPTGLTVEPSASPSPSRESSPSSTPTVDPTAAEVDLSRLPIPRSDFCDLLDRDDVEQALGGPVASTYFYGNGERRRLAPGVTDVSHEYNCTFRGDGGDEARVWVFAEPVTLHEARTLAREATGAAGCKELADAPTYGTPTAATVCRERKPTRRVASLRGLFGDAWLTCELTAAGRASATTTADRAEQWCVRVATTLGARP
jgi:hypothetical protein